jgi:hypothetical protein
MDVRKMERETCDTVSKGFLWTDDAALGGQTPETAQMKALARKLLRK